MPRTPTKTETVEVLCRLILSRLENDNMIEMTPTKRADVQTEVISLVRPHVFTEQDLKEKTLEYLGERADALVDASFTESDQYRTARAVIRRGFGDDELNGLFYQKSLNAIAKDLVRYLMESRLIEEVYSSDDELVRAIIRYCQTFDHDRVH